MSVADNIYPHSKDGVPQGGSEDGHFDVEETFEDGFPLERIVFPMDGSVVVPQDCPCAYFIIRNLVGNDPIYVGGTGEKAVQKDRNYVGDFRGMIVYEGESFKVRKKNTNRVTIIGTAKQSCTIWVYPNVTTDVPITGALPAEQDNTPPTLSAITPANGATGVLRDLQEILLDFSEELDETTMIMGTSVTVAPTITGLTLIRDTLDLTKWSIKVPTGTNLAASTLYTTTITTAVKDLQLNAVAGNIVRTFTTGTLFSGSDVTPPTVVSVTPADGATSVAVSVNVVVVFSEKMLASTIDGARFMLTKVSDGSEVPRAVTLGADEKTVTVNPSSSLLNSTQYKLHIDGFTTGVKDLAGNALQTEPDFFFTTVAPSYTEFYNQTNVTAYTQMSSHSTHRTRCGAKCNTSSSPIRNRVPRKVIFYANKTGSPTGNATMVVYNSANVQRYQIGGNYNVSALPTGGAIQVTFESPNLVAADKLAVGDRVVFRYTGGDSSNYVKIRSVQSGNDATHLTEYTSPDWHDFTDYDLAAIMYE